MDDVRFGDFLREKRNSRGISLRKLASLLDFSATHISDIENNRRLPFDLEKLQEVAEILQLSVSEKELMFDLAGKARDVVAPDLPDYIKERDYVSAALRTARDVGAGEEEWLKFMEDLKKRKG